MLDYLKLRSLSFYLFTVMLLVAAVPVCTMLSVSYTQIKNGLYQTSLDELSLSNQQLGQQIDFYHKQIISNLEFATKSAETFLDTQKAESAESSPIAETSQNYFKTPIAKQFLNLIQIYEYQNLFIGDAKGNIIFHARAHKAKSRNIYDDELLKSPLAIVADSILTKRTMIYSAPQATL